MNYGDYSDSWNPLKSACFRFAFPRESDAVSRVDYVSERVLADDGKCCITQDNVLETVLTSHPHDFRTRFSDSLASSAFSHQPFTGEEVLDENTPRAMQL